jgi:hypothetical protein
MCKVAKKVQVFYVYDQPTRSLLATSQQEGPLARPFPILTTTYRY